MNLPVAAESVLRWMLTYSLHSAVLGAAGLLAARIWLGPGSRRAVVLKVALFGALLSASLPWKAIAPLELRGQAGEAVADLSQGAERAGAPAAWAQLAGSRPIDSGLAERAVLSGALSGAPAAMTRPSTGLNRLGSSAPWWMAVIGGVSVLLVARMAFQRVRFLRSLRRSPLRDQASEALLASWSDEARTGAVALTASKNLRAPITLSSKEICVPQGCWDTLAGEERRALLAHEFAHIERKDPVWFTAAAALERVFFFLPWHRLVRERLNASAEIACDARAAERVGSAMSVARCLASVASWGAAAPALHRFLPWPPGPASS
jgi:Zn-dependent protease with chaperone function